MMKAAFFFIGCVATSAQAQNVAPSTTPDVDLRFTFLTALKATAGDEAIGCGLVEFNAASATEFGCAESALNDGKPFWLALKTDSSDANKWSAAARNKAGTLFFVTSRTGGVSRDPKKTVILSSKINKCGWFKFQRDASQPIICLRPHN